MTWQVAYLVMAALFLFQDEGPVLPFEGRLVLVGAVTAWFWWVNKEERPGPDRKVASDTTPTRTGEL